MPVTRVAGNGERGPAERASGHGLADERARAMAANGRVFFTTSWDDGHPLDQRVADLLHKHGLTGTFYVPARVGSGGAGDADVFAIMPGSALRSLAAQFEVGSHTFDHRRLDELPLDEARRQVVAGKQWLEDQLGARVPGFCYPYGSHNAAVRGIVRDSGFAYGRVTEDLYGALPEDPFLHQCVVAYASDMSLLDTVVLPHGRKGALGPVMTASLDHALWFHHPIRADDWLLYAQESPAASGARGFARGSIFTRAGKLVASVAQEGLMRPTGKAHDRSL